MFIVITKDHPYASFKPEKWGSFTCGDCIACPNIQKSTAFLSSDGQEEFKITQRITEWVIDHVVCPCNYIYVGLTSRKFKSGFENMSMTF